METLFIALGVMLLSGAVFIGLNRQKELAQMGNKIVVPPGGLDFVTRSGKLICKIDSNNNGGGIFICDHNEKPMGSLCMSGEYAVVRLYNKQGQVIWLSPQK